MKMPDFKLRIWGSLFFLFLFLVPIELQEGEKGNSFFFRARAILGVRRWKTLGLEHPRSVTPSPVCTAPIAMQMQSRGLLNRVWQIPSIARIILT